ncbi:MAG: hypothetical protein AB1791_01890 [Chloroflexota bacterium]
MLKFGLTMILALVGATAGTLSIADASLMEKDVRGGDNPFCVGVDPHPVGQRLADTYQVAYEDVMTWFCDGYGFGEVTHALETAQETGLTPAEVLDMKAELGGWGLVWQELGLIGPPDNGDVGESDSRSNGGDRPDWAGQSQGNGRPDHAGSGNGNGQGQPGGRSGK